MDLRFALRSLRKSLGFTLGALLILTLGIGANTAIFSVVNAVLLRRLEYEEPGRIVAVETFWKNLGRSSPNVSGPDFHDWRDQNTTFETMAMFSGGESTVVVKGVAGYDDAELVSAGFFDVFGVRPAAGRLFPKESAPLPQASVVSYRWAERHFGSPAAALGQTFKVDGRSFEITGVAASGFHYPAKADIWVSAQVTPETTSRDAHNYFVVGRLKRGISLSVAQQQMRAIGDRLERQYPEDRYKSVAVSSLQDRLTRRVSSTLWILLGAVSLVLLIACANVANLLLARAATRSREMAVRTAVGASRSRIVRQLLTESLVLSLLAGIAGVGFAYLLLDALVTLAPANIPRLEEVRIDGAVLLAALAASAVTSILFGLLPAISVSRVDLQLALKQGGARGSVGGSSRVRALLVVAEVALSVMLLVGAGLLLRSFYALSQSDLGFSTDRILVAETQFPVATIEDAKRGTEFYRDLLKQLRTVPGVEQAAAVRSLPFGDRSDGSYVIEGRPAKQHGDDPSADFQVVTPGYFSILGIPLKRGRDFTYADSLGRPMVVVISEGVARESFGGEDPIGRKIMCGLDSREWMEVIGIVADSRQSDPGKAAVPELFMPSLQHPFPGSSLALLTRTQMEPTALASTIRTTIRRVNPEVPVRFETMSEVFAQSLSYPRFRALLVGLFALLAAVLATLGIFSVMAYLVTQRTAEFGLRMALGAKAGDVARLVLTGGLRMVGVGLAVGLAGALALTRVLSSLLYGVTAADPLTYAAVLALLGGAALLASSLPAIRAARVDPLVALRQE